MVKSQHYYSVNCTCEPKSFLVILKYGFNSHSLLQAETCSFSYGISTFYFYQFFPFHLELLFRQSTSEHLSRLRKPKHFIDTRTGRIFPQTQIHKELGKKKGSWESDVALYLVQLPNFHSPDPDFFSALVSGADFIVQKADRPSA